MIMDMQPLAPPSMATEPAKRRGVAPNFSKPLSKKSAAGTAGSDDEHPPMLMMASMTDESGSAYDVSIGDQSPSKDLLLPKDGSAFTRIFKANNNSKSHYHQRKKKHPPKKTIKSKASGGMGMSRISRALFPEREPTVNFSKMVGCDSAPLSPNVPENDDR
jgi:hypothetical protein